MANVRPLSARKGRRVASGEAPAELRATGEAVTASGTDDRVVAATDWLILRQFGTAV